jgi:hypothetical protein
MTDDFHGGRIATCTDSFSENILDQESALLLLGNKLSAWAETLIKKSLYERR